MSSMQPDAVNGGLVIRTIDGTCTPQGNVAAAYCPPATFAASCPLTALPSDCTARISAEQVNAIVSELLSMMATLNPDGNYECFSTSNLATNFVAWAAENKLVDGQTITGAGTAASPWHINPEQVANAICGNDAAGDTLANCLRSTDLFNGLSIGSDGRLKVLPANLISTDAGNVLSLGSDNLLFGNFEVAPEIVFSGTRDVNPSDIGKTFVYKDAPAGAVQILNFVSPGPFANGHKNTIYNMSTRILRVTYNGHYSDYFPGQGNVMEKRNGVWQPLIAFQRYRPLIDYNWYFDDINGSDSTGDGLTPGSALRSPHAGIGRGHDLIDLIAGAPQITFNFADNCDANGDLLPGAVGYTGIHYAGAFLGEEGRSCVLFKGNGSNPLKTRMLGNTSGLGGIQMFGNSRMRLQNLYICGYDGSACIDIEDGSQVYAANCVLGASAQAKIRGNIHSSFILEGGINFRDNSPSLISMQHGSRLIGQGYGFGAISNCAFSDAVIKAYGQSAIDLYNSGVSNGGFAITGKKFDLQLQSYLETGTGAPNGPISGSIVGTQDPSSYSH